ncbi:MAG: M42 family metallopeptidase [Planctomycetes bacterium]|nr:M42 family metallopeptidase [Planctomycetota bacterium]
MDKETLDLLKRLTSVNGVPGYEDEVSNLIRKELDGLTDISYDKLGSIICAKKGASERPRIMLPGHMDEVGFMVKTITEQGFIKFTMLGGWYHPQLLCQRVIIKTHKGEIPGIIGAKAPHQMSEEERNKLPDKKSLFIDVGAADKKAAEKLGVRPGDPIIPDSPFTVMANPDYLMAKAWDDRLGCALFISVINELKRKRHPNTVYGVGTVQEEVGIRGAQTAVDVVNPDIAIICEVGLAQDTPGTEDKDLGTLSKGPQINIYDRGMIPHLKLRDFVIETARTKKIPYQLQVTEGGATDGAAIHIHAEGVPTIYIGVPTRYIHGHSGIIHRADYDNAVKLITEVVLKLDEKTVKRFTK